MKQIILHRSNHDLHQHRKTMRHVRVLNVSYVSIGIFKAPIAYWLNFTAKQKSDPNRACLLFFSFFFHFQCSLEPLLILSIAFKEPYWHSKKLAAFQSMWPKLQIETRYEYILEKLKGRWRWIFVLYWAFSLFISTLKLLYIIPHYVFRKKERKNQEQRLMNFSTSKSLL